MTPPPKKEILTLRFARPHRLGGQVKCVCFVASAALITMMLARGIPVRVHPLYPDRLVAPSATISDSLLRELIERHDFVWLGSVAFFTTPTGSNQTYTSDATWNNASNTVDTIGAGASGGAGTQNGNITGGGGGAWNQIANFSFATPGTTTATVQVGTGGAATSAIINGAVNGNDGGDTWFNGTTLAGSSVGSKGGLHGLGPNSTGAINGGAGGVGSSGVGTSSHDGGRGGNTTGGSTNATGGGGAAGPNGNGGNGGDTGASATYTGTDGGRGDSTSGGVGGTHGDSTTVATAGAAGTEYQVSPARGSGGGGGGWFNYDGIFFPPVPVGAGGGLYGGGSGSGGDFQGVNGAVAGNTAQSAAGAQGLIALQWTPAGAGTPDSAGQAILRVRSPGWRWS